MFLGLLISGVMYSPAPVSNWPLPSRLRHKSRSGEGYGWFWNNKRMERQFLGLLLIVFLFFACFIRFVSVSNISDIDYEEEIPPVPEHPLIKRRFTPWQKCPAGDENCPCRPKLRGSRCKGKLLCDEQEDVCRSYNLTTRDIPDTRPYKCNELQPVYEKIILKHITTRISVIMCYYYEDINHLEWSIKTLLERTPSEILGEIVLVDDGNPTPIESDIFSLPKVRSVRTPNHLGVAACRSYGIEQTTEDILVFFDSHIEVNYGWAEPLFSHILKFPNSIAIPTLDFIEESENYEYKAGGKLCGGFNLADMQFSWMDPEICFKFKENIKRNYPDMYGKRYSGTTQVSPYPTPAAPGGLFAVSRSWWEKTGGYDPGMKMWGSENVEQSIRQWCCGGTIDILPCSHVGHVFRAGGFPYKMNGEQVMVNQGRVAEVWLNDAYRKRFYYFQPEIKNMDLGEGLAQRTKISERCRTFDWYVNNIYPSLKDQLSNNGMVDEY